VAIDRGSAVKKAEDLVREGKIDLAIAEYVRLVEDQPGDVGAANALGDLYAKLGNRPAAVAQFVQIGDTHRESGFVPKAVAFYKKALKVDPASDHALSQLAQIAVEQELYADATLYLNRLIQWRREQNNEAGVAECLVRLGGFPTATVDAKMAAARAAVTHVAADQAARLWIDAADALDRAGRPREAVDVLMQASSLDPDDAALRRRVAEACAATGQIERARAFLSFETAGDHPDLLLALAEHSLAEGRDDDARRALERVIAVAPDRRVEAEALLAPLTIVPTDVFTVNADGPVDLSAAFGAGADDAVAEPEPEPAAAPEPELEPEPAPASEPESALPSGAREIEWSPSVDNADESAPEAVEVQSAPGDDAVYVVPSEPEPGALEQIPESVAPEPEPVVSEPEPVMPEPEPVAPEPEPMTPAASQADAESIAALTAAASNPALQFQASAQLGRLLLRLGRVREGIEWLERATQAATSVREQRLDVMYEFADALERAGEHARALDVFADLDFDAASFRNVPERIAALRRTLGEGRAP
jgi:tetratricopeptide (TPR) repeat protein